MLEPQSPAKYDVQVPSSVRASAEWLAKLLDELCLALRRNRVGEIPEEQPFCLENLLSHPDMQDEVRAMYVESGCACIYEM